MDEVLDVKEWIFARESLNPCSLSLHERLHYELEVLGFERLRLRRIEPHPVWSFSAKLGTSDYRCIPDVRLALKRMIKALGFLLKGSEISVFVSRERVQA